VRGGLRIAGHILLGLLLFLVLVALGAQVALTAEGVQGYLRSRLEGSLGRQLEWKVEVGKVALSPFLDFLELRPVAVTGADGAPLIHVGTVRFYPNLGSLLRGVLAFRTVVLLRPVIDLREGPVAWGGARDLPPLLLLLRAHERLAVQVDRVQVRKGEWTIRLAGGIWSLQGLDVDLWRAGADVLGESRVAKGVLQLPGRSLTLHTLQASVALEDRDLVVKRIEVAGEGGALGVSGRIRNAFEEPGLDLNMAGQVPVTSLLSLPGAIRVEGHFGGSPRDPHFEGLAHLEGATFPDLWVKLSADREGMRGESVRKGSHRLSGHLRIEWREWRYAVEFRGRGLPLDGITIPGVGTLPVAGVLSLEARAVGHGLAATGLTAQGSLQVSSLGRRGRAGNPGTAAAVVRADGGRVSLERLQVDLPPDRLIIKGFLWEELKLEVSGKLPRVDLIGDLLGAGNLGGSATVVGQVTGALMAPKFQGVLTWDTPRLLGIDLRQIRGGVLLEQRTLSAPHLFVSKGESTGTVELRITWPEKEGALDLDQDLRIEAAGQARGSPRDWLSVLLRREIPFTGQLQLSAAIAGAPARLEGRGHLLVKDAVLWGEPWQVVEAEWRLEPERLQVEEFRLTRGNDRVDGSGLLRFADLGTSFRFAANRLSLEGFRLFAGTGLGGVMGVEARGEGPIDNPSIRGDYRLTALRYATLPLGQGQGDFLIEGGEMTTRLAIPERGYSASGRLQVAPPHAYQAQVTMKQADLAPLFALADLSLLQGGTGIGSGGARMEGDLQAPRLSTLTLDLEAASLRIDKHTFQTAQPLRLNLSEETLTISSLAVTGKEGWLNVTGQIAARGEVDLGMQGKIPLALLLRRQSTFTGVTGTGELDLKISGLWKAPRYMGSLKVKAGGFHFAEHPEAVEGVGGLVDFQGHKIQVPTLDGRWAGGKVRVSGTASRTPGKGWQWILDPLLDAAAAERAFSRGPKMEGGVTGSTRLWGQVTAQGSHWEELQGSLRGKLSLDMKGGRVYRFTVLGNILRLLNLTPDPVAGIPYDSLKANFHLKGGVLETEDLQFVSDTVKVGGVGKIDLGRGEVNMLLAVQPLRTVDRLINFLHLNKIPVLGRLLFGKEGSVLVVAFEVKGPLREPEVVAVPEESLGRGIFGIFRRLFELPAGSSTPEGSRDPKASSSRH
jgi:hypothetical protein